MKKILVITAFPPCQKTAGQDYTRRMILDLVDKNFEVGLIYAEYPRHEVELSESVKIEGVIKPHLSNCLKKPGYHPFFTKRYNNETLDLINKIKNNYDHLYFDFSQVHLYSIFVDHPSKILMCHDVIFQKYLRSTNFLNVAWVKDSEKKTLKAANKIITFSKKDSDLIKEQYSYNSIAVNFYLKNESFNYDNVQEISDDFCFYGAWNRMENTEALEFFLANILPSIKKEYRYRIIGGGMSNELQDKIKKYSNISYLGFVDDPVLEVAKCQALIAPLHYGAGVKVKVVDALTSGTPVIGTSLAFEGIMDNNKNKLFNLCEQDEQYISLLNDWKTVKKEYKKSASQEFLYRYNNNHFPEHL